VAVNFSAIRQAFNKRLIATGGLPEIAWENRDFKPSGDSFIQASFLPTQSRIANISQPLWIKHEGLSLLTIYTKGNIGPVNADNYADNLLNSFYHGLILLEDNIEIRIRYSERGGGNNISKPWYQVPVTVGWYSYIQ
jgi:hypothetical protein